MTAGRTYRDMIMTTSTFKITVPEQFLIATRPHGVEARAAVVNALARYENIELDFAWKDPSPSFADECIGVLCKDIGWESFRQRVRLSNISEMSRSLFKHVISRRRAEAGLA